MCGPDGSQQAGQRIARQLQLCFGAGGICVAELAYVLQHTESLIQHTVQQLAALLLQAKTQDLTSRVWFALQVRFQQQAPANGQGGAVGACPGQAEAGMQDQGHHGELGMACSKLDDSGTWNSTSMIIMDCCARGPAGQILAGLQDEAQYDATL